MLKKSIFNVFLDVVFILLSVYLAVVLRTDDWALLSHRSLTVQLAAVLVPCTVTVLWLFRVYRGSWRLASVYDVFRLNAAVAGSGLLGFFLSRALLRHEIPLAIFVLFALVMAVLNTGTRLSYRMLVVLGGRSGVHGAPALIYGAGEGGVAALREMMANGAVGLRPVGFVDDDPERVGRSVNGVPVVGSVGDLDEALRLTGATALVLASRRIPDDRVAQAQAVCERNGVRFVKMEIRFEEYDTEGVRLLPAGIGEPAA